MTDTEDSVADAAGDSAQTGPAPAEPGGVDETLSKATEAGGEGVEDATRPTRSDDEGGDGASSTARGAGTDIPGIELGDEIGRGGFGIVYRAHEPALDRTVAIKLLTAVDNVARERFGREGRALGTLSGHPHIAVVHAIGTAANGVAYINMAYYAGGSVRDRIADDGPLGWQDVIAMGVKLAAALDAAHRVGILHRDVKPSNVLLDDYGEARLADFGIARLGDAMLTKTGAITGSLSHAAPEVLDGAGATERSDVYSLGSTLFELVTGTPAFAAGGDEPLVAAALRAARDPVPDLRLDGVPDPVATAIEAAMAKDPNARPVSASAFGHALQDVQREVGEHVTAMPLRPGSGPATPAPLSDRDESPDTDRAERADAAEATSRTAAPGGGRRRRIIAVAITAGVILVVAAVAAVLATSGETDPDPADAGADAQSSVGSGPADLDTPLDIALGDDGSLLIADTESNEVERLDPDGTVTTIAGTGAADNTGDGRTAVAAGVAWPSTIAAAPNGDIYVLADGELRVIGPDGRIAPVLVGGADTDWIGAYDMAVAPDGRLCLAFDADIRCLQGEELVRIAGADEPGYAGDGGPASQALVNEVNGITFADDGTLYLADTGNDRVRKITPDGNIATVAGGDREARFGDGAPATRAALNSPAGVAIAPDGDILIAEQGADRVRRVLADGTIVTVAGDAAADSGFAGDGGPATEARFSGIEDVEADALGSLYILDTGNNRVRKVAPDGTTTTVA